MAVELAVYLVVKMVDAMVVELVAYLDEKLAYSAMQCNNHTKKGKREYLMG